MNKKIAVALLVAFLGTGFVAKKVLKYKIDHYGEN